LCSIIIIIVLLKIRVIKKLFINLRMTSRHYQWCGANVSLAVTSLIKCATDSGVFHLKHWSVARSLKALIPVTSLVIINTTFLLLSSSHKQSNTLAHLTNYLFKIFKFFIFLQRPDLNFHHIDEENYTAEEPSGSSFLTEIFSNYDQSNS
jgi:hypothetical protein